MKAHKLAEILLKMPNRDLKGMNDRGEVGDVIDAGERVGVIILHCSAYKEGGSDDDEFRFPFDAKEAFKELGDLEEDLGDDKDAILDLLKEYKVSSMEELLKTAKKDEKLLKKIAYEYFFMK